MFWCSIKKEYPQLSKKDDWVLFIFLATYLCKARFSSHTSTKTTYCNRLKAELDMRIQLSSIKLYIKEICKTVKKKKWLFPLLLKNIFHKNLWFMSWSWFITITFNRFSKLIFSDVSFLISNNGYNWQCVNKCLTTSFPENGGL